jgi:hypothetical protein
MYKIFTATIFTHYKRDCGTIEMADSKKIVQLQGSIYGWDNNILSAFTKVTSWQPPPTQTLKL